MDAACLPDVPRVQLCDLVTGELLRLVAELEGVAGRQATEEG